MQIDESQEIYLYHRPQRWTLWTLKTCHRVLHNFQEHRPSYLRFFIINISTRFPVFCKALHIGWKYSWVQKDEYRLQKSTSIYIYKMVRLYKYIDAGHRLQNSMYMCIVYIQLCIYIQWLHLEVHWVDAGQWSGDKVQNTPKSELSIAVGALLGNI